MRRWFALSAIGRDRPGIVADLAELIYECDCNLEDSSMTILGTEFAVLLLLSGEGDDVERRPGVAGASRTDAGVHAAAQVASVNLDVELSTASLMRAINVRLPLDIRILQVEDAAPGFHARFHARGKSYRYRLARSPVMSPFDRAFAWHVPDLSDVRAMRYAAAAFVGRHDFASFQARGSSTLDTVRTIERLDVEERGHEVVVEIEGDGFLRHMVRAVVGTLVEVGSGLRGADTVPAILAGRHRRAGGPTAPARGLMLIAVRY
jgi:tRNA pseudouridine38-40 synthase